MKWIAAISVLILVASLSTGFTVFAQTDRGVRLTEFGLSAVPERTLAEIDEMIETFGDTMPDEYHPPVPVNELADGSFQSDPLATAMTRIVFAQRLLEHGYEAKAARVVRMVESAAASGVPIVPLTEANWASILRAPGLGMRFRTNRSVSTAAMGLDHDCDDDNDSQFINNSSVWIRTQGDYHPTPLISCANNYSGWICPGCTIGDGVGFWYDTDHIWNCYGDLTVGSATYSYGEKGWHHRNGFQTTIEDAGGSGNVYATNCTWGCGWQDWDNCP